MVHTALHRLELHDLDFVFIENVGNLVCPASFDLGQHRNVILLSSPEGDDKPQKYPVMFRAADLLLLTKSDLTPVLGDFDPRNAEKHLRELANEAPVLELCSCSGAGMGAWLEWLEGSLQTCRNEQLPVQSQYEHRAVHRHD
jgi:hydrogenase nickel incorporation protein HypB